MASFCASSPTCAPPEEHRDDHAHVAENRADGIAHASVEFGVRKQSRAEPARTSLVAKTATANAAAAVEQRRKRQRDAANGEAAIGRAERAQPILRLDAPRLEHRRRGDDHDRHPHDALHDHDDLGQHVPPQADGGKEAQPDCGVRLEQRVRSVADDHVDQIEAARQNGQEKRLIDQEVGEGDVARRRRREDDDNRRPAQRSRRRQRIELSGFRACRGGRRAEASKRVGGGERDQGGAQRAHRDGDIQRRNGVGGGFDEPLGRPDRRDRHPAVKNQRRRSVVDVDEAPCFRMRCEHPPTDRIEQDGEARAVENGVENALHSRVGKVERVESQPDRPKREQGRDREDE